MKVIRDMEVGQCPARCDSFGLVTVEFLTGRGERSGWAWKVI